MEDRDSYIKALIDLHGGLERQGPGDADFSKSMIEQIPDLPPAPRIADLGCGAGAGSLILAEHFRCKVKAVDLSQEFLDQLITRARQRGLEDLIEVIKGDIGSLDWEDASLDLIWSEGAAYNITFRAALTTWRPLLVDHGIAVISEMNYFTDNIAEALSQSMRNLYPAIKTEAENVKLIDASGFEVLGVHRLPSKAWWDNYYGPLGEKIRLLKTSTDPVMQYVIGETEEEMRFFEEHHKEYGYTYYIMRAEQQPRL